MDFVPDFITYLLQADQHLPELIARRQVLAYLLLAAILFCETGLVVAPFLPGDVLLFTAGALAAGGRLEIGYLLPLCFLSALAGDSASYGIGRLAPRLFPRLGSGSALHDRLAPARDFYARHSRRTVLFSRFIPMLRSLGPFVAGMAAMPYPAFLRYNAACVAVWAALYTLSGYFLGSIPFVQRNLGLAVFVVIAIVLAPGVIQYLRGLRTIKTIESRTRGHDGPGSRNDGSSGKNASQDPPALD